MKDFGSKGCPRGSVILVFCHVIYSHHVNCIEKLNRKAVKDELKRNTTYSSSVKHVRNGPLIVSLGQWGALEIPGHHFSTERWQVTLDPSSPEFRQIKPKLMVSRKANPRSSTRI